MGRLSQHFRKQAEIIERIGDEVGPNNMELSNLLWYASSKVREYAKRYEEEKQNDH